MTYVEAVLVVTAAVLFYAWQTERRHRVRLQRDLAQNTLFELIASWRKERDAKRSDEAEH